MQRCPTISSDIISNDIVLSHYPEGFIKTIIVVTQLRDYTLHVATRLSAFNM